MVRHADSEASLTTSAAAISLRMLFVLQEQLSELRLCAVELGAAVGRKNQRLALEATLGVRDAIDELAVAYTRLRTLVVAFDGAELGDTVESLGELAIRAKMFVVAVQLSQLDAAIGAAATRDAVGAARARGLFSGRFHSICDVAWFVRWQFGCINALWLPHRKANQPPGPPRTPPEERATRYRDAIRDAQGALTAIGEEPSLAPFLRAGAESVDWLDVHTAASLITIALQLDVTAELDLSSVQRGIAPMPMDVGVPWRKS